MRRRRAKTVSARENAISACFIIALIAPKSVARQNPEFFEASSCNQQQKVATGLCPMELAESDADVEASVAATSGTAVATGSSYPLLPLIGSTRQDAHPSRKLRAAVDELLPSLLMPWRRQWRHQQLARSFQVVEPLGGVASTLNLSPKIDQTLSRHVDPARLMSGYINRECKGRLGDCPPYSFIFEHSVSGRLDLHGAVIPEYMDEAYIGALDKALMRAGGRIEGTQITQNMQNYLQLCHYGLGWAGYVQKTYDETAHMFETNKITFISNSLRRLCTQKMPKMDRTYANLDDD